MTHYILAHDLGTSGDKATLFTEQGELVTSETYPYDTRFFNGNWAEQRPSDWWDAVCATTRRILQQIDRRQVAAVSFSGQMMGCVCVDARGNALCNAIIWADQRAVEETAFIREHIEAERFYQITGHRISPSYSAEKLMWVRNNEPDIFSKTHKLLNAKDYIIYKLTGKFVTEYSDASGTHLLDLSNLCWSQEILDLVGFDENILPDLVPSTHVAGGITREAAEKTGLLAGTPVVMGGGDGLCAGVGAGCVKEGMAYTYVGSSSWISLCTSAPVFDEQQRTFNWPHIVPGMYSPCGTMQAAGASFSWLQKELALHETISARQLKENVYDHINNLIQGAPVGSNGLLFLPYLLGERSPWWNAEARGALIGLKMEHTRADVFRAVLEGITLNLGLIADIFKEHADINEMVVIGGGAQSHIWRQLMADIYERPVLKPNLLEEATSMGAAITGGVGVGLFDSFDVVDRFITIEENTAPTPDHFTVYRQYRALLQQSYKALVDVYTSLQALPRTGMRGF
jgi:xylulokinase